MGAAVDETALAICVRETLQGFLHDHEGLEAATVEVTGSDKCTLIDVEGFIFQLKLEGGHLDSPNDEADRAMLLAGVGSELLNALKDAVDALALCDAPIGHPAARKHNAISLGRAVIAKAEGRL
jgi:hypothetical protein